MPVDPLALQRRRQAAHRLEPLACGCRDPWSCTHRRKERPVDPEVVERARQHLAQLGLLATA